MISSQRLLFIDFQYFKKHNEYTCFVRIENKNSSIAHVNDVKIVKQNRKT